MAWRYLFIALFALQTALVPWLASASKIAIQQDHAEEDRLLVCTGSSYRWISLSQSAVAGDYVFIEEPSNDAPKVESHLPACVLGWLQLDHVAFGVTPTMTNDVVRLIVIPPQVLNAYSVQTFAYSSRGPPNSPIV